MSSKAFIAIEVLQPGEEIRDRLMPQITKAASKNMLSLYSDELSKSITNSLFEKVIGRDEAVTPLVISVLLESEWYLQKILTIGFSNDAHVFTFDDTQNLHLFWFSLEQLKGDSIIVGHDIYKHGLSLICKLSAKYHLNRSFDVCFGASHSHRVFDTMTAWTHGDGTTFSLNELAMYLNLISPQDEKLFDQDEVQAAYLEGRYEDIVTQCNRKAEIIRMIYYRLVGKELATVQ